MILAGSYAEDFVNKRNIAELYFTKCGWHKQLSVMTVMMLIMPMTMIRQNVDGDGDGGDDDDDDDKTTCRW